MSSARKGRPDQAAFPSSGSNRKRATQGCPCGYYGSSLKECVCTPPLIQRYLSKISGPLLDRIDLHIDVAEVKYRELTKAPDGEKSSAIAQRVREARAVQMQRYKGKQQSIFCNAQIGPPELERHCRLDAETKKLLGDAVRKLGFSARAYDRVLKVGRTIADLEGSDPIRSHHISEAIQYRWLDRNYWERM